MTSRSSSLRWVGLLAALGFLAGHLPFLVWFLDDIDPINFALGLRHYDIAQHQPHPPGYPILILLGKIAAWGFSTAGMPARGDVEAGALALWGIVFGAMAAFPLLSLYGALDGGAPERTGGRTRGRAAWAMGLAMACPLFWFTAGRPLSDVPGLAAALVSVALCAAAFAKQGEWASRQRATVNETGVDVDATGPADLAASGKLIVLGALMAGLAIGLRSQTFWLTLPVLALVIFDRAGRGAAGALLGSLFTFGIGAIAWFVPMVIATGGPSAYLNALYSQGAEDFGGVDMLWTSAAPAQRLMFNLVQTFIAPWVSVPLALAVLACAGVGVLVLLARGRRALLFLAVLSLPYAALHLLFHENETIRYALPLVIPVAYLAIRGVDAILRRVSFAGAAALIAASLFLGAPALQAYAAGTSPIFQLFDDMHRAPQEPGRKPVVAMHRRVFNESKRARQWAVARFDWTLLPATRGHEWLDVVKVWRDGGAETPVWFIGDPRRTDLALIDPAVRQQARRYRWPVRDASDPISRFFLRKLPQAFDDPALIGGARPDEMDWYVFDRPGWFLEEGWALTPETSGVADAEGKGPARGDIVGHLRRRAGETRLMIGGRNLGAADAGAVRFTAAIDGRVIDTWDVLATPGFFLKALTLPAGALTGEGAYARLTVRAQAADATDAAATGAAPVRAAIEQFDLQGASAVMFGFDTGWLESEYQPKSGLAWRWASGAAALRVWHAGRDVRLRLRAESPLRYFDAAPNVTVKAGDRVLLTFPATGDIDIAVDVPAAALDASNGTLIVSTDKTFSPAERTPGVTDRRRLGLRVFDVSVTPR